jgi:DNA polymerase III subunit alpha
MTLLAQNRVGYQNLLKLVTASHIEGFYYRPRMDREILEKYSEGLIVLSGCPSGELARYIKNGDMDAAHETLEWYGNVFQDRYYLEMMMHEHVPDQAEINQALIQLSNNTGLPMVVTNDSHYVRREDSEAQDILTCIQTNSNIKDPKRLHMEDTTYYLRSGDAGGMVASTRGSRKHSKDRRIVRTRARIRTDIRTSLCNSSQQAFDGLPQRALPRGYEETIRQ